MEYLNLIIVAGPPSGGKSTWSGKIAAVRDCPVVATDDYRHLPWDEVPGAAHEGLHRFDEPGAWAVLEGVRALSVVMHYGLAARVREIWWCEGSESRIDGPCKGLVSRQRALLAQLRVALPECVVVAQHDLAYHVVPSWADEATMEFRSVSTVAPGQAPGTGVTQVIPSRLHTDDITATITGDLGYEHIIIPMEPMQDGDPFQKRKGTK